MLTIFWRTIKDRRLSLLIYCIASLLFIWMYIALFPSISESFGAMEKMLESFPKGFLDAFGFDAKSFVTFEGYIGSEEFTLIWPIMIIALTVSSAGGAIAGEVEKGTAEIILSQPISRLKVFFSKYMAAVLMLAIFIFISVGSIFPFAAFYNIAIKSENFIKLGFLGFMLGMAILSLSMLFSSLFSDKGRANFIPAGILILMYVINIIAGLQENLKNLKYISFFYYYNPSKLLVHGQLDNLAWWVFLGTFIVATTLAAFWFSKRDIAV